MQKSTSWWIVSSAVILVAILVSTTPVEYALQAKYVLPEQTQPANLVSGGEYTDFLPSIKITIGSKGFPMVVSPNGTDDFDTIEDVVEWTVNNKEWLYEKLYQHGGILFRGFTKALAIPQDFEKLALTLEPDLEEFYLGTSTRSVHEGTRVVHSASNYPGWRIIPSHMEMSFLPELPTRQFFYAYAPNSGDGGETPLVDFRQVFRDLNPKVVEKFKQRKVKYIRMYNDPDEGPCYNYFIHKDWQSMFKTNNATLAGELAKKNGFNWSFDKEELTVNGTKSYKGTMKLIHVLPPTRIHPVTGDEIWSNHMNVLHVDSIPAEFAFSAQHLRSWKYVLIHHCFEAIVAVQSYLYGGKAEMGHHVTHEDGEMDREDVDHIKQTVWKNTIIYKHQKGDVALLDNKRVGHGRQPYKGTRTILTTWH